MCTLKLIHRDGVSHETYPMTRSNGLWYHMYIPDNKPLTVKRLNYVYLSALWYGQLGCAGNNVMDNIHKHVKGIDQPLKRNFFYKRASYFPNKIIKRALGTKYKRGRKRKTESTDHKIFSNEEDGINGEPGHIFHMDFGLVRGSTYRIKQEHGLTTTSIDGFNSYLIIVDRVTRYIWVFLTTSKSPPMNLAQRVIKKSKSVNEHRTVRTNQGGELGRSSLFQKMVDLQKITLKLTGSGTSAQNGVAESPKITLVT